MPAHLNRVDALITDGTLDGENLNAADFQIGTTTRTLLHMPPLRKLVSGRPAERHAMRVAPSFGEEIPLTLPAGFEGRADAVARRVADELAGLPRVEPRRLARLTLPPLTLDPALGDGEIARGIAKAIHEQLIAPDAATETPGNERGGDGP